MLPVALCERQYKSTTLLEKIRHMKLAIKYVIHAEDFMMTNKELLILLKEVDC